MRTSRHGGWILWTALAACACVMLGAMTWLTREVLSSERQRTEAEARAAQEERLRLALWRMDALGASMLLSFNQQSPETFRQADPFSRETHLAQLQFDLTEKSTLQLRGGAEGNAVKQRKDLQKLLAKLPRGEGDFNTLTSCMPAVATSVWSAESSDEQELVLNDQQRAVPNGPLIQAEVPNAMNAGINAMPLKEDGKKGAEKGEQVVQKAEGKPKGELVQGNEYIAQQQLDQQKSLSKEASYRQKAVEYNWDNSQTTNRAYLSNGNSAALASVGNADLFLPTWLGDQLFLLRRVQWQPGSRSIQGVWLDGAAVRAKLLAEVVDLLPQAKLVPTQQTSLDALTLASFPWTLQGGPVVSAPVRGTVRVSLVSGWITAIVAIAVAAILVHGVMRLSERRASFVSAVTHELRTPLTTFRLYSDMLESGVVKEERRGEYFKTLRREADRLAHLVENVLAFSRIERGSARAEVQATRVDAMLESMRERFESRLASVGMELKVSLDEAVAGETLKVDTAAVEHVLFNLVDNAAKYAASGADKTVVLSATRRAGWLAICLRDHGPGISNGERRKIFRAFHKSAQAAAESQPGVGLGLALSQRLAHQLGGRLTHQAPQGRGAVFCMELPAA